MSKDFRISALLTVPEDWDISGVRLYVERALLSSQWEKDSLSIGTVSGVTGRRVVLQDWVCSLTLMQQSVLITAVRGPDGLPKDHVAKLILRWYRRCVLLSAFDRRAITNPYELGGGSFTGPSLGHKDTSVVRCGLREWQEPMNALVNAYLGSVDELPHHFQLHLMHAAEIIGYKHPEVPIRQWWLTVYHRMVNDMHLCPETEETLDKRLGDNEANWRAAEEVTAKGPQ